MNHSLVFHWTGRFISKCQLTIFSLFTFCQNTKAIAFVFWEFFWGQNTSSEWNLMTPCVTCRVPLGHVSRMNHTFVFQVPVEEFKFQQFLPFWCKKTLSEQYQLTPSTSCVEYRQGCVYSL